ncbi:glycosyltransferase, MGT family, partial [Mesorhizobium muleiense]
LAPLGGTVVVSTGSTEPADLGPLPANVLARRSVPQLQVLARAALFVTHGGMNSVNEAMRTGVPTLVVPQGADQPMVARRVVELGAGLELRTDDATAETVQALARSLLDELRFREAAAAQGAAQRQAGGARRAADELERYLDDALGASRPIEHRGAEPCRRRSPYPCFGLQHRPKSAPRTPARPSGGRSPFRFSACPPFSRSSPDRQGQDEACPAFHWKGKKGGRLKRS